jgi:hypothetical protein
MGRAAEAVAFAGALIVSTCAATYAAVLPDGTYRYAVKADGKQTATTTVTISHDASSVTVKETIGLDAQKLTTTRVLDPQTFSTRSWSADDPPTTIAVSVKSATYTDGKKTTTLDATASAPAAVFDFFVAEFATLPAMIHATGADRYNEYCVCLTAFQTKAVAIVPPDAARPAGALPGDVAMALRAEGKTVTLWYDPQTFIMRELDFPQERISYIRL